MQKPIWMTTGDWDQLVLLKTEWSKLMLEHRSLRKKVRSPDESSRMSEINKRVHEIDKELKIINDKNPILPQNIIPHLRLEKLWQRFWELHDDLLDVDNLSPKDRFNALSDVVNIGRQLIEEDHPKKNEIEPPVAYFMGQLIYSVHVANEDLELILEVSNSFGDQIVRSVSQQKNDNRFKKLFVEKISGLKPDRPAVFSYDQRMTTNWQEVVQWIQDKLGA